MPKKDLYPKFERERREHPSLSDKVVWRIVYDHERKKKRQFMTNVIIVVVMSLIWGAVIFYATRRIIEEDEHGKSTEL